MFDNNAGGSFIEAALYSWGVTDDQLFNTVARRLKERFSEDEGITWPPKIKEVENDETPDPLLYKFLQWLHNPSVKEVLSYTDPTKIMLSSLLKSYISRKRTQMKVRLSVTIHGLTRSRELVDLLRTFGLGISYNDVKTLYASWTNQEITNHICPPEIADNFPAVAVMDNDDFKDDTLTGAGTSHRTNVMFVQNEHMENKSVQNDERPKLVTNQMIKSLIDEVNHITL